jgi:RNA polymerase sigma-70 factor (sigma-E family)
VEPLTELRPAGPETVRQQVTALYQAHALGLVRLAVLMVGDQQAAEDVVQDAFLGLYRRWPALKDPDRALSYARSSVLNGCRMVLRSRFSRDKVTLAAPDDIESAEATALLGEANREVIAALRRLPARQREAVVLRYYLDMTEDQAAQAMRVSRGTVKSATSRGLAALGRLLKEEQ